MMLYEEEGGWVRVGEFVFICVRLGDVRKCLVRLGVVCEVG